MNGSLTPTALTFAALLVIGYFLLNYWGVKLFARANSVITTFKFIIPAATILGLMLTGFHSQNFGGAGAAFAPYGWSAVFTAVATSGIVFSFNGFQESGEPGRRSAATFAQHTGLQVVGLDRVGADHPYVLLRRLPMSRRGQSRRASLRKAGANSISLRRSPNWRSRSTSIGWHSCCTWTLS